MFNASYRKRLEADLPKWREAGWVTPDGSAAILASVEARRGGLNMATIAATLGALLIGVGVIAFVAANWDGIARLNRFALLMAGLAVAYGLAGVLRTRTPMVLSEAAMLVAGLTFGASIALVGQSYHLAGEFKDAVLMFEIGIFAAAILTRSPVTVILGLAGAAVWTWESTVGARVFDPHWAGVVPVALGLALASWLNSRAGQVVGVVGFIVWLSILLGAILHDRVATIGGATAVAAAIYMALWLAGVMLAGIGNRPRLAALGQAMLWPALLALLLALGLSQAQWLRARFDDLLLWVALVTLVLAMGLAAVAWLRRDLDLTDAIVAPVIAIAASVLALYMPAMPELTGRLAGGAIVLGTALWCVRLGFSIGLPGGRTIGLIAFGIEVFVLYLITVGTLLQTSLAFLGGGLLLIALSVGIWAVNRRLTGPDGDGSAAPAGDGA